MVFEVLKAKPIIQPTVDPADSSDTSTAAASLAVRLLAEQQKVAVVSNQLMKDEHKSSSIVSPTLSGKKIFRMQALPVTEINTALKIPHWKCASGGCDQCGAASTRFMFQCGIEYDKSECVDV